MEALIFGGTVLILLTCFMRLENARAHAVLVGAVAVLLSLLLYVIYTLDHPFGPIGVTPQPFRMRSRFSTWWTAVADRRSRDRSAADGLLSAYECR